MTLFFMSESLRTVGLTCQLALVFVMEFDVFLSFGVSQTLSLK